MHKRKPPIGRRKFLKAAGLAGAAAISARAAKAQEPNPTADPMEDPSSGSAPVFSPDSPASSLVNPGKPMPNDVTAAQVREALQLEPNQTCGYVRATYKSALYIAPGGLPEPFAAGRALGTALFFMVTPQAPVQLHRIENDQLYHYYGGDPIEVLMLYESGTSELVVVGPNILGGQLVQLFIPGGTFHTARITGHRRWFLGGSTEWPGVDPARDVELGDVEMLAAKYPEAANDLRDFPTPQEPPPPAKPEPEPEPVKCPEPAEAAAPEPPQTPTEPETPSEP
jgi:uncharacterized protein